MAHPSDVITIMEVNDPKDVLQLQKVKGSCPLCGWKFHLSYRLSDYRKSAVVPCPICKSDIHTRVMPTPSLRFMDGQAIATYTTVIRSPEPVHADVKEAPPL